MGNEMHVPSVTYQVLMVASPNDPQVSRLATALRVARVSVLVANTVEVASQVDEFAICIIVLRPGQWRTTPAITTAMRSNPRYLIPVLAEPMPLPAGAWSTEAILLTEPLSNTVHELKTLIDNQLHPSVQATPKDPKKTINKSVDEQKTSAAFRASNSNEVRSSPRMTALIQLVIGLVMLAMTLYYMPAKHSVSGVSAFKQSNVVSVPGPGCNTNNSDWWSVSDNSVVATCQPHGLHVQQTGHYDTFAEVFFGGSPQAELPQHFSTQVTMTALNPSLAATFLFGVRRQLSDANNKNGYGDDELEVGVDGSWQTVRVNDRTGQDDATFTRGFVKPGRTMVVGAEVEGPRITYSINGQKVTTIVDTTFPSGYSISFGLNDSIFGLRDRDAKSASSALYSNFSYQPLANTHQTVQSMVATATAQANANLHAAYTAAIPGFGCDKGPGQWQPVTKVYYGYAIVSCRSNGLALLAQYSSSVPFYGLDGNLPTNYKVKVRIDTSHLGDGCAGVGTRVDVSEEEYSFFVCPSGWWYIMRTTLYGGESGTLSGEPVVDGYVKAQTSYIMVATANKDVQSLSLNGVTVATIHDATLRTTDHIELTTSPGRGDTTDTALFSNFVFTPLP